MAEPQTIGSRHGGRNGGTSELPWTILAGSPGVPALRVASHHSMSKLLRFTHRSAGGKPKHQRPKCQPSKGFALLMCLLWHQLPPPSKKRIARRCHAGHISPWPMSPCRLQLEPDLEDVRQSGASPAASVASPLREASQRLSGWSPHPVAERRSSRTGPMTQTPVARKGEELPSATRNTFFWVPGLSSETVQKR